MALDIMYGDDGLRLINEKRQAIYFYPFTQFKTELEAEQALVNDVDRMGLTLRFIPTGIVPMPKTPPPIKSK